MGGTDDPDNLVELTVEEHAEAHKKLWEEHGEWQDYLAWQGLLGLMPKAEIAREASRLANLGNTNRRGSTHTPEARAKMRAAKLGKKFGKRKSFNMKKRGESHGNYGKPWSEARRAAHEARYSK